MSTEVLPSGVTYVPSLQVYLWGEWDTAARNERCFECLQR